MDLLYILYSTIDKSFILKYDRKLNQMTLRYELNQVSLFGIMTGDHNILYVTQGTDIF